MIAAVFVIAFSGSTSHDEEVMRSDSGTGSTSVTRPRCVSTKRAVAFYSRRIAYWRTRMGAASPRDAGRTQSFGGRCPRHLAHVLQRKAYGLRRSFSTWVLTRYLRDYEVSAGNHAWHRAVREVQKAYPGTEAWLLSCSASEGGHGRWVPNSQGSGAGGFLQFMESTFWRMYGAAKADVTRRGYRVPASAASWYSALGQALAGAWGYLHGRKHEWYGAGCR